MTSPRLQQRWLHAPGSRPCVFARPISRSHSWVNNSSHGLILSGRSRWGKVTDPQCPVASTTLKRIGGFAGSYETVPRFHCFCTLDESSISWWPSLARDGRNTFRYINNTALKTFVARPRALASAGGLYCLAEEYNYFKRKNIQHASDLYCQQRHQACYCKWWLSRNDSGVNKGLFGP